MKTLVAVAASLFLVACGDDAAVPPVDSAMPVDASVSMMWFCIGPDNHTISCPTNTCGIQCGTSDGGSTISYTLDCTGAFDGGGQCSSILHASSACSCH
jgi:hypothetical protein